MHSVKIEFSPLDWYSSSPTTIVLYNRMYMCKLFSSNRQKLKNRKCNLHLSKFCTASGISTSSKRRNSLRHEKPINW